MQMEPNGSSMWAVLESSTSGRGRDEGLRHPCCNSAFPCRTTHTHDHQLRLLISSHEAPLLQVNILAAPVHTPSTQAPPAAHLLLRRNAQLLGGCPCCDDDAVRPHGGVCAADGEGPRRKIHALNILGLQLGAPSLRLEAANTR